MKRTHVVSLYRRSGVPTEDSHGREVQGWGSPYATAVPANVQALSGSVEFALSGRDPEGKALLFVDPAALPVGWEVLSSDGVVVTSGRSAYPRYLVSERAPIAERGEGWDDEFVLDQTEEAIP